MTRQQLLSFTTAVVLLSSGAGATLAAGNQEPSTYSGNQGEGFGEEQVIHGTGQIPMSSPSQNAQITLGGARPVIEGEVRMIQGEDFIVRDAGGDDVHVRVNKDTNIECRTAEHDVVMSTGRKIDESQEIQATRHMTERMGSDSPLGSRGDGALSEEQKGKMVVDQSLDRIGNQSGTQAVTAMGTDSGGDIARGSGFVFTSPKGCEFTIGNKVRAEVSDLGTVLFLKQLPDRPNRPKQRMSGQMVPIGGFTKPQPTEEVPSSEVTMAPADLREPTRMHAKSPHGGDAEMRPNSILPGSLQPLVRECKDCVRLRGQVMLSDYDSLLMKNEPDDQEVRIYLDKDTRLGQVNIRNQGFLEGDRIEAYVKPDGHADSVNLQRELKGIPGVEGDVGGG
jgi:hypothetical protein